MARLILAAALFCGLCFGEESCPWLNSATAAGILGHSVTVSVTHAGRENGDAACDFTSDAVNSSTLRIEVRTMANPAADFASWLAQCGSRNTPVRGIGNQAVACSVEKGENTSEQILSRVRNRALLVRVTAKKTTKPRLELREQAQTAGELAAGNLF